MSDNNAQNGAQTAKVAGVVSFYMGAALIVSLHMHIVLR